MSKTVFVREKQIGEVSSVATMRALTSPASTTSLHSHNAQNVFLLQFKLTQTPNLLWQEGAYNKPIPILILKSLMYKYTLKI